MFFRVEYGLLLASLLVSATCVQPARQEVHSSSHASMPPTGDVVQREETRGISEVQARQELDAMFRAAGYRVLNDEPVRVSEVEITLDGYDPVLLVGYEYIDALEAKAMEFEALLTKNADILVLPACSVEVLRKKASAFLQLHMVASDPT